MTREDIIRMAKASGLELYGPGLRLEQEREKWLLTLEVFTVLVVSAERDRLHDKFIEIHKSQQNSNNYWHFAAHKIMEGPNDP
jgi:hypothetical protein